MHEETCKEPNDRGIKINFKNNNKQTKNKKNHVA